MTDCTECQVVSPDTICTKPVHSIHQITQHNWIHHSNVSYHAQTRVSLAYNGGYYTADALVASIIINKLDNGNEVHYDDIEQAILDTTSLTHQHT